MKSNLAVYLIIVCCFSLVSCRASEQSNARPISVQLSEGVGAIVSVGYDDEHGHFAFKEDANLGRMFDGKTDTYWTSETRGCHKVGISVVLEKPAYLKRVRIIHHGKIIPTVGSVIVDQSTSEDTYSESGSDVKLDLGMNQELDVSKEYYPAVLKGHVFTLFLLNCNQAGGRLEIAEIKFEFSDMPTMKPTLTAENIKAAVKAVARYRTPDRSTWHFANDDNEPNKKKYLSHLMYYGLLGDEEADKIFKNYYPTSTDLSEEASDLQAWYEESKKTTRVRRTP